MSVPAADGQPRSFGARTSPPFGALYRLGAADLKSRLAIIYAVLAVLNGGAWLWALLAFQHEPALLGVAALVYGLGLRHGVDADHIAAIDNVTRKLMADGKRPVAVGFFFALGHSTVVVLVAAVVAGAASLLATVQSLGTVGGTISTGISALFLLAIAVANIVVFAGVYRTYRRVQRGGSFVEADIDLLLDNRGFLSRLLRPLFRLVRQSWHMFPLGFLFGLGFDTATEIAMFGIAGAQAAQGMPVTAILVFPLLFAAGMSLVDTTGGVMVLGAYEWAFVTPMRKLHYNLTITFVSILVALLIGGIEGLGLLAEKLELHGGFWTVIASLNDDFTHLGFAIIGIFALAWLLSYVLYKAKDLHRTGPSIGAPPAAQARP